MEGTVEFRCRYFNISVGKERQMLAAFNIAAQHGNLGKERFGAVGIGA